MYRETINKIANMKTEPKAGNCLMKELNIHQQK